MASRELLSARHILGRGCHDLFDFLLAHPVFVDVKVARHGVDVEPQIHPGSRLRWVLARAGAF